MIPTEQEIFENLDNALENGAFDPNAELENATAEQIAVDMISRASNCENAQPEDLIPHIIEWLQKKRMTTL